MKKILLTVLTVVLASSVLAGCSKEEAAGTDASPAAASPAATDTPAASPAATDRPAAAPDADLTPASTDTETNTEEVTSAMDLTDYPVMWCKEYPFNAEEYDSCFRSTSASKIYEKDDVIGTEFVGFRLIDDTHIEKFTHVKLNDDIDASLLLSSLGEESFTKYDDMIRINDWEVEWSQLTLTYEIDGANIFISDGQNIYENYSVSPDFTSFFVGQTEYTYHADF